jgi:acyl-CoA synthetase (AMP-forming)/AMP-acid ligase II
MGIIIGDLPRVNACRRPDGVALVDQRSRRTWQEFDHRVGRLGRVLLDHLTLGEQQTVAILSENRNEYVELMFAASRAGLRWTGLNTRHHRDEMSHQLVDSEARVLVHDAHFRDVAVELGSAIGLPTIQLGEEYESLLLAARDLPFESHADEDLPYALTYTSGTTGVARGALITSRNDLALAASLVVATETRVDDVFCVMLPLFHKGGQFSTMHPMSLGQTLVVLDSPDPAVAFEAIEREKVSVFVSVPTVMRMLVEHRRGAGAGHNLSSIRHVAYGSNPIPIEQIRDFSETFGCDLSQIGGIGTEGGIGLSLSSADHRLALEQPDREHILRSCGTVQPRVEMRLVDELGREVATDEIGEMTFRGDAYIPGYLNQPEANARLWRDGWLYSGDLGRRDRDGYVYYVERLGGRIKTGGESVLAREVEEVLMLHPSVASASVLGVPDDRWGEAITAVVVLTQGAEEAADMESLLRDHVRSHLSGYKVPKTIHFVEQMPLTALGKIARGEVRDLVRARSRQTTAVGG